MQYCEDCRWYVAGRTRHDDGCTESRAVAYIRDCCEKHGDVVRRPGAIVSFSAKSWRKQLPGSCGREARYFEAKVKELPQ